MMNSDRDAGRRRTLGREETLKLKVDVSESPERNSEGPRNTLHDVFFFFVSAHTGMWHLR